MVLFLVAMVILGLWYGDWRVREGYNDKHNRHRSKW
jgi:hypothetical protein